MKFLELFLGFLKVGCFTFGGGYAAVPLIRDVVLSHGWLTEDALTYMIAVSESTPGPIMVNLATYVGSSQAGILGALLATTAVVLPSFCIILLIQIQLKNLIKNPKVKVVLQGMQPCVVGIILTTGLQMIFCACVGANTVELRAVLIGVILTSVILVQKKRGKKKISTIGLIILSAILGMVFYGI